MGLLGNKATKGFDCTLSVKSASAPQNQNTSGQKIDSANTQIILNKSLILDINHRTIGIMGAITHEPLHTAPPQQEVANSFTMREIDVLKLLIRGLSVKSIALNLCISTHTVAGHLKLIYTKLDAHSKNEAVFKAMTLFELGVLRVVSKALNRPSGKHIEG